MATSTLFTQVYLRLNFQIYLANAHLCVQTWSLFVWFDSFYHFAETVSADRFGLSGISKVRRRLVT